MCETIANVRRDKRKACHMPDGKTVTSLEDIDAKFGYIPRERRGELSRNVLGALPSKERIQIDTWVGTTTKVRPVHADHTELMVFLAAGHYADKNNMPIEQVCSAIVAKQSAVGFILPAA